MHCTNCVKCKGQSYGLHPIQQPGLYMGQAYSPYRLSIGGGVGGGYSECIPLQGTQCPITRDSYKVFAVLTVTMYSLLTIRRYSSV